MTKVNKNNYRVSLQSKPSFNHISATKIKIILNYEVNVLQENKTVFIAGYKE